MQRVRYPIDSAMGFLCFFPEIKHGTPQRSGSGAASSWRLTQLKRVDMSMWEFFTFRVMFMLSFIWGFIYFRNVCYNVLQCVDVHLIGLPGLRRCHAKRVQVLGRHQQCPQPPERDICIKQERGWKG
jgi:hypothetical protein